MAKNEKRMDAKKLTSWLTKRKLCNETLCKRICESFPDECPVWPLWQGLDDVGDTSTRLKEYAEDKYLSPGHPLYLHVGVKQQLLEIAGSVSDPADDFTAAEVGMDPVRLDEVKKDKRIEGYRDELKKKGFEIQTPDEPDVYKDGGGDDDG